MTLLQLEALQAGDLAPWNLQLQTGDCLCIKGPSGIGKSRLLRAIADLDEHQGHALLDGVAANDIKPCQWRRQVGMLAAESAWWSERVGDHFPEAVACEASLAQLGFSPEVMQWEVARLSTGEKQRLALIRLLCNQPKVLLLDEPTASLDPVNVGKAEQLIHAYLQAHQAAAIWVSHDPEQSRRVANRQVNIEDGSLHEVAV